MKVGDFFDPARGTAYAKSVFGPADRDWPAISFSLRGNASRLTSILKPDSDIVVAIGTSGASTEERGHRSHLLSIARVRPDILPTKHIIPEDSWSYASTRNPDQWEYSLPVTAIWVCEPPADARRTCPLTYSQLGVQRGQAVPFAASDMAELLKVEVREEPFTLRQSVEAKQIPSDLDLKREIARLAAWILMRVAKSGLSVSRTAPTRTVSGENTDVQLDLFGMWKRQQGRCKLCGAPIPIKTDNRLLQLSPDRIDSGNPSYGVENLQLTHLACNLAKSDGSQEQFVAWLETIRSR